VNARDTLDLATLAASATWLIVGACLRPIIAVPLGMPSTPQSDSARTEPM
jgi:hypothetical protein